MTAGTGAELRTVRVFTGVVAALTVAAVLATTFVIAQPERMLPGGSYWVALATAMALPLLAGVVAPFVGMRVLRVLNAAVVVEHALLLAVLLLAAAVGVLDGEVPWFFTFTAIPVTAALIAAGTTGAWLALAFVTTVVQAVRVVVGGDLLGVFASDVQAFFASVALVLLFGALIRAARELDGSLAAGVLAVTFRSEEEARAAVTKRLQALVHDELLSLLVLASRDAPSLRGAIADEARRVRGLIRQLHEPDAGKPLPLRELAAQLASIAREEAPDAVVTVSENDGPSDESAQAGVELADALRGALRQALVNSRTHAGPAVSRTVSITLDGSGIAVELRDDGVGFDPARVPSTRMGIASSIVGRLRAVPGGDASVRSRPGAGTLVELRWAGEPRRSVESPGMASSSDGILGAEPRIRRGLLDAVRLFLLAQLALAVSAGLRAGEPWVALLGLVGVGAAFAMMGWRSAAAPRRARAWSVVICVVATAGLALMPIPRDPLRYGDTWFIAAAAFVLLVLAVRGRPGIAAAGGFFAAAVAIASAAISPTDAADALASGTRLLVILGTGLAVIAAIRRMQRRSADERAREIDSARESAYREAARRELVGRTRELDGLIGDMLERLGEGEELTPAERRECSALEGRLRDQYRAGRLARAPLVEAAMGARRRGIDVVLLDDAPDRGLDDAALDDVAAWLAARLTEAVEGRFTGRILPADRDAVASAVTGDETRQLNCRSHPCGVATIVVD